MDDRHDLEDGANGPDAGAFGDVPVVLTVSVGRARTPIATLLSLDRNAVLPLDSAIGDPVTVYAGDRVVAYGELQEAEGGTEGRLSVRITELAPPTHEP